jgi:hypothetical protein
MVRFFMAVILLNVLAMPIFFGTAAHARNVSDIECPAQKRPEIRVRWKTDEIRYNFTKSRAQLGNMPIDTKSPYDKNVHTEVGGLMRGGLEVRTNTEVSQLSYEQVRMRCLWVSELDIVIHINPIIYVASEFPKGTCMHNSVLEHEFKHIAVDRAIASKYKSKIRDVMGKAVYKIGIIGPRRDIEVKRIHNQINQYIEQNIKQITDQMYAERRKLQQGVDNFEEYERVRKSCN